MGKNPKTVDLEVLRRRVKELTDVHASCKDDYLAESDPNTDSDSLLKDCALHLHSRVNQILSEYSSAELLEIEELDSYFEDLQGELKLVESENAKISKEIEVLKGTYVEDLNRFESGLEGLKHKLDYAALEGLEKERRNANVDCYAYTRDHLNAKNAQTDNKFESLKLNDQIEKNNITLKSLKDLDDVYRRLEAVENIEDAMSGIKVLGFDKNSMRLALTTYIPHLERLSCQYKFRDITETSELSHELIIEVMAGSMELKNAEIFPNDVYLAEIIDATKSFRQSSQSLFLETSPLGWFVRKVQDKIILGFLRKYVIKHLNTSRHSFEFLDRDDMIVAHMVGGVGAFIKASQGWPISNHALKLVSLKASDHHSKGISLSFLCKVEEVANALDICIRQNITSFVDSIEETLVQQMNLELHSDSRK